MSQTENAWVFHDLKKPIVVNMRDHMIPVEGAKLITPKLWGLATLDGKHIAPLIFHIWTPSNGLEVIGWPLHHENSKIIGLAAARTYCHAMNARAVTVMWEAWFAKQTDPNDTRMPSERPLHEREECVMLNVHESGKPMQTYAWEIQRRARRATLGPMRHLDSIYHSHEIASHWCDLLPKQPHEAS